MHAIISNTSYKAQIRASVAACFGFGLRGGSRFHNRPVVEKRRCRCPPTTTHPHRSVLYVLHIPQSLAPGREETFDLDNSRLALGEAPTGQSLLLLERKPSIGITQSTFLPSLVR